MLLRVDVDVSGVLRCTTTLYDLLFTGLGVNDGSTMAVETTSMGGGMGLFAEAGDVALDAVGETFFAAATGISTGLTSVGETVVLTPVRISAVCRSEPGVEGALDSADPLDWARLIGGGSSLPSLSVGVSEASAGGVGVVGAVSAAAD